MRGAGFSLAASNQPPNYALWYEAMNIKEAKKIHSDELGAYREKPYAVLTEMIEMEPTNYDLFGESGAKYQI